MLFLSGFSFSQHFKTLQLEASVSLKFSYNLAHSEEPHDLVIRAHPYPS